MYDPFGIGSALQRKVLVRGLEAHTTAWGRREWYSCAEGTIDISPELGRSPTLEGKWMNGSMTYR